MDQNYEKFRYDGTKKIKNAVVSYFFHNFFVCIGRNFF